MLDSEEESVLLNVLDSTHGAFVHAITATDAGLLIHDGGTVAYDLDDILLADVHANAASRTFVGVDDGTGHVVSYQLSKQWGRLGATTSWLASLCQNVVSNLEMNFPYRSDRNIVCTMLRYTTLWSALHM
jgi:hypothetical protein